MVKHQELYELVKLRWTSAFPTAVNRLACLLREEAQLGKMTLSVTVRRATEDNSEGYEVLTAAERRDLGSFLAKEFADSAAQCIYASSSSRSATIVVQL